MKARRSPKAVPYGINHEHQAVHLRRGNRLQSIVVGVNMYTHNSRATSKISIIRKTETTDTEASDFHPHTQEIKN